jgi:hypothetical protein
MHCLPVVRENKLLGILNKEVLAQRGILNKLVKIDLKFKVAVKTSEIIKMPKYNFFNC